jgi:hypothetical protein
MTEDLRKEVYEKIYDELNKAIGYFLLIKGFRDEKGEGIDIGPYKDNLFKFKRNLSNQIKESISKANEEDLKLFRELYEGVLNAYRNNMKEEADRKSEELKQHTIKILGRNIFEYVGEELQKILSNPSSENKRRRWILSIGVLVLLPFLAFKLSQLSIQGLPILSQPTLTFLLIFSILVVTFLAYLFFKRKK